MAMSRGRLPRRPSLLSTHSLTSPSPSSCKSKVRAEDSRPLQKPFPFTSPPPPLHHGHHQTQSNRFLSRWIGQVCGKFIASSSVPDSCKNGNSCQFARFMATAQTRIDRKKRDLARREFQLMRRKTKLMRATMSPEEKILWRLKRANRKRALLLQRLKKYELDEDPEPVHDPELITPEQLQALKKIGYKNRNYAPIGRRGVFGGVVQNMHMHWKFHETVQVDCHILKREDMKTIAKQLAILSGGIVIDIHQKTNIIMYRGRNYKQPKTEMIPKNTLTKRKALFKSKFLQALDMIEENIKNLNGELLTLRRKQKENISQDSEVSKPPEVEMLSGAEYDYDDGGFSWESDSLDEDELSEDEKYDHKNAEEKSFEVENIVKPISWTAGPALHDHKQRPRVAKELVVAENQLFMHKKSRPQERESSKHDEVNDEEEIDGDDSDNDLELGNDAEIESYKSLQSDNVWEAKDEADETETIKDAILQHVTSCRTEHGRISVGQGAQGRVRNKKIAQFLDEFGQDDEENKDSDIDDDGFGTDLDGSEDLGSNSNGSEEHKFEFHKSE